MASSDHNGLTLGRGVTRRRFLGGAAAAAGMAPSVSMLTAAATAARSTWFAVPAFAQEIGQNEKLRLGIVGTGGRGWANFEAMHQDPGVAIIAICDVDSGCLNNAAQKVPDALKYDDYRTLLSDVKDLDGIVISAPDHHHALPTVTALRKNLHVYCEKPLVQSPWEARLIAEEMKKHPSLATQMGTPGQCDDWFMQSLAVVRSGSLGEITEVHVSTDRPIWPQGEPLPNVTDPVPESLNWDLWVGPRTARPFIAKYREGRFKDTAVYHPFVWRGWWDFGSGALGDIAPHSMNVAFRSLQLGAPTHVEVEATSGMVGNAFSDWTILRFDFPAIATETFSRGPVSLHWYDGKKVPEKEKLNGLNLDVGGVAFVGTKGIWYNGIHPAAGQPANLYDGWEAPKREDWPEQPFPEVHADWLQAIREGRKTGCAFEYSAPMTEAYQLGNVALKVGKPLDWNAEKFTFGDADADAMLKHEYRDGWTL